MELKEPFDLTTLQVGDELVLVGPAISVGAFAMKVLPHEVILHWYNTSEGGVAQVRLLGMHLDIDKMDPFGERFRPMVLSIHPGASLVLTSSNSEDTELEELEYFCVTRDGEQIFEAGTKPEPAEEPAYETDVPTARSSLEVVRTDGQK